MRNQGLVVSLLVLAACLLALLSQSIRVCLLVNKSRLCLWRDWGDFERWEREERNDKRRCVQEEKEKVERDTEAWEVIRAMFATNRLYAACAVAMVQTNWAAGMWEMMSTWWTWQVHYSARRCGVIVQLLIVSQKRPNCILLLVLYLKCSALQCSAALCDALILPWVVL